jgi:CHAT domain-containing protein
VFRREAFESLPASEEEITEVTSLWSGAAGAGEEAAALALTGASASETAFKMDAPGKRVVHVATHGFFLGGECPSALERGPEGERGFGAVAAAGMSAPGEAGTGEEAVAEPAGIEKAVGATTQPEGENPLVLSGLAFAGANNREHAGPEEDDGILTAQEIAAMDLSSVEWAVLSACDTGVGEIRAGEGVFGLRRAFQVAGADTLIMSLWSVEDESARRWMKALYEGRLTKGMDTAEAVRNASLTVLNDRREQGLSDHPAHWAGFVAAGDWK